jgi:hypothetical protein
MGHDDDAENALDRLLQQAGAAAMTVLTAKVDAARRLAELRGRAKAERPAGEAAP